MTEVSLTHRKDAVCTGALCVIISIVETYIKSVCKCLSLSHHLVNAQRHECVCLCTCVQVLVHVPCPHAMCALLDRYLQQSQNVDSCPLNSKISIPINVNGWFWVPNRLVSCSATGNPPIQTPNGHRGVAVSVLISKILCLTVRPDRCAD
jgi:hypothetical protein